jgi:sulfofructose kinase
MPFDVVGVGHATLDLLGVVPRHPEVDTKTELQAFSLQGGGPVATALCTLAALGNRTAVVAKLSDDIFGQLIRQGLEEAGVATSGLVVEPGRVSPVSFIAVERDSGRRNIYWTRGDVGLLTPAEVPLGLLSGARALHVDGVQMEAQLHAAREARRLGIPVMYDAGSPRPGSAELVGLTDLLVTSERFAVELGGGTLAANLRALRERGPRTVVVTLGVDGAVGLRGEDFVSVPALEGPVVDTTGAGDVYHGAFLHAHLKGLALRECMRFASAAAGLKCRSLGGRAGIASEAEVRAAMDET